MPYIEKQNGNIYAKRKDFENAVMHYNKALFAMKMLFENEDNIIPDQETAVKYIREIEIPVCLNLSLSYLKVEQYHYSIKYASQVLDKEDNNAKALYRRGQAYMYLGENNKAKQDFNRALELSNGKDQDVIKALHELKKRQDIQRQREIEFSRKMMEAENGRKSNQGGQ